MISRWWAPAQRGLCFRFSLPPPPPLPRSQMCILFLSKNKIFKTKQIIKGKLQILEAKKWDPMHKWRGWAGRVRLFYPYKKNRKNGGRDKLVDLVVRNEVFLFCLLPFSQWSKLTSWEWGGQEGTLEVWGQKRRCAIVILDHKGVNWRNATGMLSTWDFWL